MRNYKGDKVRGFMVCYRLNSKMLKDKAESKAEIKAPTPQDLMGTLWSFLANLPPNNKTGNIYHKKSKSNYIWMMLDDNVSIDDNNRICVTLYKIKCKEKERYAYLDLGGLWINLLRINLVNNFKSKIDQNDTIFEFEMEYLDPPPWKE